jgi:hypothetical protein
MAIVTIAVQMWPITALAHAGHTHGQEAIAAVAHNHPNGDAAQVNAEPARAENRGERVEVTIVELDADRGAASGKCNDACCPSGFSCCAPAMLSEGAPDLPVCIRGLKLARLRTRMQSGVDPETLPKPPKSFT